MQNLRRRMKVLERLRNTLIILALLTACTVGPDYVRPAVEKPDAYKESQNWKQAQPNDNVIRGKWWEIYNDPELNKLEEQIDVSNQNVQQAEAQYREARAVVAESESGFFPVITGNAGVNRSASAVGNSTSTGGFSSVNNQYNVSLEASWVPDIWGLVRRQVEESKALAQMSEANLGAVKLSMQGTLAIDYLSLRSADEQIRLLDTTVKDFERTLAITNFLYKSGVDARSDYLQAKAQLEATEAQAIDAGIARAQFEHAIAILVGKPPANFTIEAVTSIPAVPVIPLEVPSVLLERRPDIAAAERQMAAANAQVGVTTAAFYPNITLSASGGFASDSLAQWFSVPNRVWSIGTTLVQSIFDAGLRKAQTQAAIAAYDATVAAYRQTVLGDFQTVEDNLAALRILEQEETKQQAAVDDAKSVTTVFVNQYKAGLVSYLSVVTAQNTQLTDQLTALNIRKERLTASAALIEALGGGWNVPASTTPPPAASQAVAPALQVAAPISQVNAAPVPDIQPATPAPEADSPPTSLQMPAPPSKPATSIFDLFR